MSEHIGTSKGRIFGHKHHNDFSIHIFIEERAQKMLTVGFEGSGLADRVADPDTDAILVNADGRWFGSRNVFIMMELAALKMLNIQVEVSR